MRIHIAIAALSTLCFWAAPTIAAPGNQIPVQKLEQAIAKKDNEAVRGLVIAKHPTMRGLPASVINYLLLCMLDDEVSNGGFMQFFFNDNFETKDKTRLAVQEICGRSSLALYDQALKAYLPMKPEFAAVHNVTDPDNFRKAYSEMAIKSAPKNDMQIDDAWYRQDKQRLTNIFAYVVAHKNDFAAAVTR